MKSWAASGKRWAKALSAPLCLTLLVSVCMKLRNVQSGPNREDNQQRYMVFYNLLHEENHVGKGNEQRKIYTVGGSGSSLR